jgi:hypothetical protein
MEFRYITIKVNGAILDTFFTVRLSNQDTIHLYKDTTSWGNLVYPVLTDAYQIHMVNRLDSFRFCGFINQTQVVNEVFVIKANECHIDYVSGRTEVTL